MSNSLKQTRQFDQMFDTPVRFKPEGRYISRREYTRQEAADVITEQMRLDGSFYPDEYVDAGDLEAQWVRWTFPPAEMRGDLPSPCWMVCMEGELGAQPVWGVMYG